jgi:hypothetical protein
MDHQFPRRRRAGQDRTDALGAFAEERGVAEGRRLDMAPQLLACLAASSVANSSIITYPCSAMDAAMLSASLSGATMLRLVMV